MILYGTARLALTGLAGQGGVMKYKYKCICGRVQTYSAPCIENDPMCLGCSRWPMELIKEEEPMSDCETGARIREKIVKHWINENLHGEAGYAGTIMSWDSASSYSERLGENSHYVFADAYLTTKEIDCLHRNLSKEAFAATGLKAPEKKFEPHLIFCPEGEKGYVGVADKFLVSENKQYKHITDIPAHAQLHILANSKKYLGVPPLDDLANQKLRKLDKWAERSEYPAISDIRAEIARLLKEPVSFEKGV